MAKLKAMPSKDVIDGLRGVLDIYTWCDQVIVRKWPHYPSWHTTKKQAAWHQMFAYANRAAARLPSHVKHTWKVLHWKGGLTWKDWFLRFYLSGRWGPPKQ